MRISCSLLTVVGTLQRARAISTVFGAFDMVNQILLTSLFNVTESCLSPLHLHSLAPSQLAPNLDSCPQAQVFDACLKNNQ